MQSEHSTPEDFFLYLMDKEILNSNFIITFFKDYNGELERLKIQFKKKGNDEVVNGEIITLRNEQFNNYYSISVNGVWFKYLYEGGTTTQDTSLEGYDYQIVNYLTNQIFAIVDIQRL